MKILYIRTMVGRVLGLDNNLSILVEPKYLPSVLKEYLSKDYVLITFDFLHNQTESILSNITRYTGRCRDVVVIDKRKTFLTSLFAALANNPLKEITGLDEALAVLLDPCVKRSSTTLEEAERSSQIVELDLGVLNHFYLFINRFPKPIVMLLIEPLRVTKFALVGLTGFFVNLLTLYTIYNLLINRLPSRETTAFISSLISFETSLTWNFVLHEAWTFRDLDLDKSLPARARRWGRFHVGSIGSMLAQVSIVTLLSGFLGFPLYLSLFLGVAIGLSINYLLGRFYAWRK